MSSGPVRSTCWSQAVDHHRAAAEVADHLANLYGAAYGAGVGENWRAIAESRRLDAEQDEAEENHHVNV